MALVRNKAPWTQVDDNEHDFNDDHGLRSGDILSKLERGHHGPNALEAMALEMIPMLHADAGSSPWRKYGRLAASVAFGEHTRDHLRKSAWEAIASDARWAHGIIRSARKRTWGGPKSPKLTAEAECWLRDDLTKLSEAESTTDEFLQAAYARDPQKFVRLATARNPHLTPKIARELLNQNDNSIMITLTENDAVPNDVSNEAKQRLGSRKW